MQASNLPLLYVVPAGQFAEAGKARAANGTPSAVVSLRQRALSAAPEFLAA